MYVSVLIFSSTSNNGVSAISVVGEVVEQLKRENVAIVSSFVSLNFFIAHACRIETDLAEYNQEFDEYRPLVEIYLKQGEYGHVLFCFSSFLFFSTLQKKKKENLLLYTYFEIVIEIFELHDKELKGELSVSVIGKMNLPEKFYASTNLRKEAETFIKDKTMLNLPGRKLKKKKKTTNHNKQNPSRQIEEFVYYCSILIHPLLLEFHFKCAILALNGKVDLHDGPLPAVSSEAEQSVLVPAVIGREKPSKQREHLFDDNSEQETNSLSSEQDNLVDDYDHEESTVRQQHASEQKKRRKFIGIWKPKHIDESNKDISAGENQSKPAEPPEMENDTLEPLSEPFVKHTNTPVESYTTDASQL
ncbi:hypothetical protein RFI_11114 [Reticulomyxa filosa]|uniref:Uncharacterized protein n=1 Tax=Reticulomyxa filosa TaxID=46433 RepID=X6NI74_RETFI|nr:hypothetical protein RFI_11114 [Reticulomyxa filosa]|eukprot:ETO26020.1 hypothetical protein RFI_11114 [Reticulomyxa filosa]